MERQWQPWGASHPVRVALRQGALWLDAWAAAADTPDEAIIAGTGIPAERLAVLRAGAKPSTYEMEALAKLWQATVPHIWSSMCMPSGRTKDFPASPRVPTHAPSAQRMTQLALWTMERAFAESQVLWLDRNNVHRLALGWLVHIGVAHEDEVRTIWRNLVPRDSGHYGFSGDRDRHRNVIAVLDQWHARARLPVPEEEDRANMVAAARQRVDVSALAEQFWRMCNRYRPGERDAVTKLFGARQLTPINDGPSIVHPRDPALVIRWHEGGAIIDQMTWGFPVVLKGKKGQPLKPKAVNNARFDKLRGFWRRWADDPHHRCLIPTTAFAEAEGDYGSMTTTWLSLKDQPIFAWAGLWTVSEEWGAVYTGVMTDAAPELMDIHDRCPVILRPEEWDTWLKAPLDKVMAFDRPLPADQFQIERTKVPWSKGGVVALP